MKRVFDAVRYAVSRKRPQGNTFHFSKSVSRLALTATLGVGLVLSLNTPVAHAEKAKSKGLDPALKGTALDPDVDPASRSPQIFYVPRLTST